MSSGHDTVMVHDGRVTDQLVAYHRARAEGGAGLIIVQVAGIHETARYTSHVLMATDDSCIEGYRRLVAAVAPARHDPVRAAVPSRPRGHGDSGRLVAGGGRPLQRPNERFHVMPRALEVDEIDEIVAGYAAGGPHASGRRGSTEWRSWPATAISRRSS